MIRQVASGHDEDSNSPYIVLKVVRHSQDLEIHFRVKKTTMVWTSLYELSF